MIERGMTGDAFSVDFVALFWSVKKVREILKTLKKLLKRLKRLKKNIETIHSPEALKRGLFKAFIVALVTLWGVWMPPKVKLWRLLSFSECLLLILVVVKREFSITPCKFLPVQTGFATEGRDGSRLHPSWWFWWRGANRSTCWRWRNDGNRTWRYYYILLVTNHT